MAARLLLLLLSLSLTPLLRAQDAQWQMTITGLPPQGSLYLSDLQDILQNGQVRWGLNYFGQAPATVYLNYVIASDRDDLRGATVPNRNMLEDRLFGIYGFDAGAVLAYAASRAIDIAAGPYADQQTPLGLHDVYNFATDYSTDLFLSLAQTNRVPEGQFALYYWLTTEPNGQGELLADAYAGMLVSYPAQPLLIAPDDQGEVTERFPTFTWEPVVASFGQEVVYRFVLKELLPNQNAEQAIRSNPVHYETFVSNLASLVYPVNALDLEGGNTYVWRIEALNADEEPLMEEYFSEAFSFTRQVQSIDGASASVTALAPAPNMKWAAFDAAFLVQLQPSYQIGGFGSGMLEWLGADLQLIYHVRPGDSEAWFADYEDADGFEQRFRADGEAYPIDLAPGPVQQINVPLFDRMPSPNAVAWRVVATTASGLQYASTPQLLIRDEVTQQQRLPMIAEPLPGTVVADAAMSFRWLPAREGMREAPRHRVRVQSCEATCAPGEQRGDVWEDVSTSDRLTFESASAHLTPGQNYAWFVESFEADGSPFALVGLTSQEATFTYAPASVAPRALDPANEVVTNVRYPYFTWEPALIAGQGPAPMHQVTLFACEADCYQGDEKPIWTSAAAFTDDFAQLPYFIDYPEDAEPLKAGVWYAWRIEALDAKGQPLDAFGASDLHRFQYDPAVQSRRAVAIAPDNDQSVDDAPVFTWEAALDAQGTPWGVYGVTLIHLDSDFEWRSDLVADTRLAYPADASPLAAGTYQWIVEALDKDGASLGSVYESRWATFRFDPAITAARTNDPAEGVTTNVRYPYFTWYPASTATHGEAPLHQLTLFACETDCNALGDTKVIWTSPVALTNAFDRQPYFIDYPEDAEPLDEGVWYAWQIEPLDEDGNAFAPNASSAVTRFRYAPEETNARRAIALAPDNGEQVDTVVFNWAAARDADGQPFPLHRLTMRCVTEGCSPRTWTSPIAGDTTLAYPANAPFLDNGRYEWIVQPVEMDGTPLGPLYESRFGFFTYERGYTARLRAPNEAARVGDTHPTFQWNPVPLNRDKPVPMYGIEIERCKGDDCAPLFEAMANEPRWRYPDIAPPLEPGAEYAWRIVSLGEPQQDFQRAELGESPTRRFTYDPAGGDRTVEAPERVELEDEIIYIEDFEEATVTEQPDGTRVIDGPATLVIDPPQGEPLRVPIEVEEMELEVQDPAQPEAPVRPSGGSLRGGFMPGPDDFEPEIEAVDPEDGGAQNVDPVRPRIRAGSQVYQQRATSRETLGQGVFEVHEITWTNARGLRASGAIHLPGDRIIETPSPLRVTANGLDGEVALQSVGGRPLAQFGDAALGLTITRAVATFPAGTLTAEGDLRMAGEAGFCRLEALALMDGAAQANVDCTPEASLNLAGDAAVVADLATLNGQVNLAADGTLSYDVNAEAELVVALHDGPSCRMETALQFADGSIRTNDLDGDCAGATLTLRLGDLKLRLHDLDIERLGFDGGDWQFEIGAQAEWQSPNFVLPRFDFRLGDLGLTLPRFALNRDAFDGFAPINLGLFDLRFTALTSEGFTLPWASLSGDVDLPDFDVNLSAELFGDGQRTCFDGTIALDALTMEGSTLRGDVPVTAIDEPGCPIPLGEAAMFHLRQMGGALALDTAAENPVAGSRLDVRGVLEVNPPCPCGGPPTLDLADANLTLRGDGLVEGQIDRFVPDCPIALGAGEARITASTLTFGVDEGVQTVLLDATADLTFGDQQIPGTFTLDVATGTLTALRFELDDPFQLDLPAEAPALSFRIDRAVLTLDGLSIDGRHTLDLGDTRIGATFDEVNVDLRSFNLQAGRVMFDEAFAFELGINPETGAVTYRAVPYDAVLQADPGALIGLAGQIALGPEGLVATGEGRSEVRFEDIYQAELTAQFAEDFVLSLNPAQVQTGRVTLRYEDQRAAVIDATGFHPDPLFFGQGLIPEFLPLPSLEVAFIRLKTPGGALLLNHERIEANTCFSTRPGEPLDLVLPVLDPASPPRAEVEFRDVCVDPVTFELVSGLIRATPPAGDPAFDWSQRGVPLGVEAITAQVLEGEDVNVLSLDGYLILFGQDLGNNSRVTAHVYSDGHLTADLDVRDLGAVIPIGDGERFTMTLDALQGRLALDTAQPEAADYRLDVSGALDLRDGDGAFGANMAGDYTARGFDLTRFEPYGNLDPLVLPLGDSNDLTLSGWDWRTFRYTSGPGGGFDFRFDLDLDFRMDTGDGDPFSLNIPGLRFTPSGFDFPRFEYVWNAGGDDDWTLSWDGFELQPLRFALDPFTFDWFNWAPGDDTDFNPSFDLSLRLPNLFGDLTPGDGFTLRGFSFADGVFSGDLRDFSFPGWPTFGFGSGGFDWSSDDEPYQPWMFGGDWRWPFTLGSLDLRLFDKDGSQGFDLGLRGRFFDNTNGCDPTDFALNLDGNGARGTIAGLHPCQPIELGPMTLSFEDSEVTFVVANDQQAGAWMGQAVLSGPGPNNTTVSARGNLMLDLASGEVLDGFVELAEPFLWDYPTPADPLFGLNLRYARYDASGLLLDGEGALSGEANVAVRAEDLRVTPESGQIQSGRLVFDAPMMLIGDLDAGRLLIEAPNAPQVGDNRVWLTLPEDAAFLAADGLHLQGNITARLRMLSFDIPNLRTTFTDAFRLDPRSFDVLEGRMSFFRDQQRLAYYDAEDGWQIDEAALGQAVAQVIPDTLYLPSREQHVAYLVLREPGQEQLNVALDGGTLATRRGQQVDLVVPALAEQGRFPIAFSVRVDDALNIVDGSLDIDRQQDPLTLDATGVPLDLLRLQYATDDQGQYTLRLMADLDLPASMSEMRLRLEDLLVGPDGLERVQLGADACGRANVQPLATQSFADGAFTTRLHRVDLDFTADRYTACGDVTAPVLADADGTPSTLHFSGTYADAWRFDAAGDNLPDVAIGTARFDPNDVNGLTFTATEQEVSAELAGVLILPDVLGSELALGVERFRFDSRNGLQLTASAAGDDELRLMNDHVRVRLTRQELRYAQGELRAAFDGRIWLPDLMDEPQAVAFTDLRVSSRGEVALGAAAIDLLPGNAAIPLLGDAGSEALVLDQLGLAYDDAWQLTLGGYAQLPGFGDDAAPQRFALALNERGEVQGEGRIVATFDRAGRLGEGVEGEFELGEVATLDVQQLGVDFTDLARPAVFANGALYLNNDPNDALRLGRVDADGDQAGFYWPRGADAPTWNLTAHPGKAPAFDLSLLTVELETIRAQGVGADFRLELGGGVLLDYTGLEAEATWSGLQLGLDGVEDAGQLGPDARLVIDGLAAIGINGLEFGSNQTIDIDGERVRVDDFLRFDRAVVAIGSEDPASSIFSGDVVEVLYYATPQGDTAFRMNRAVLSMGGEDGLTVRGGLSYQSGPDGYELFLAGSTSFMDAAELNVAGGIRNVGGEVGFGLAASAALDGGVPIVPGVLSLTGLGGGFFYNAPGAWIDATMAGFGFDRVTYTTPDHVDFAVLLYGEGALLEGVGEVQALIKVDNRAFEILMEGYVFAESTFEAYGSLLVTTNADGGVLIDGRLGVDVNFDPVLTGGADLNFYLTNTAGGVEWAILGAARLDVLDVLRADANLMFSNAGFLSDLRVRGGIDIAIVEVNAHFGAQIWALRGVSWGAYMEMGVSASVLGGLASIGADIEGALIYDNQDGFFLYGSASAYVEVLWVFEGRVRVWVSLDDDGFDAGEGRNRKFDRLIARAQEDADQISNEINEAAGEIAAAFNSLDRFRMDEDDLATAGYTLLMAESDVRQRFAAGLNDAVRGPLTLPIPSAWNTRRTRARQAFDRVRREVITSGRPSDQAMQRAAQRMNGLIDDVDDLQNQATSAAQNIRFTTLEAYEEAQALDDALRSPLSATWPQQGASVDEQVQATFSIDEVQNSQNVSDLNDLRQSVAALDATYRTALTTVRDNLAQVDALLGPQSDLNRYAERYYQAYEASEAYLAQHADYLWMLNAWARRTERALNDGLDDQLNDAIAFIRDAVMRNEHYAWAIPNAYGWTVQSLLLAEGCPAGRGCDAASVIDAMDDRGNLANTRRDQMNRLWRRIQTEDERNIVDVDARTQFGDLLELAATDVWLGLYEHGLPAVDDTTLARIAALDQRYSAEQIALRSSYAGFTGQVDDIYRVRANLAATFIAMIDEYTVWKAQQSEAGRGLLAQLGGAAVFNANVALNLGPNFGGGQAPAQGAFGGAFGAQPNLGAQPNAGLLADLTSTMLSAQFTATRARLVAGLAPPEITAITVTPGDLGYDADVAIRWQATHPQGIAENSFGISRGGSENIYGARSMQSVGPRTRITHWSYAPVVNEREGRDQTYSVAVRVRGMGGVAATRRATYQARYRSPEAAPAAGGGRNGRNRGNVLADDDTPPSFHYVRLPEHRRDASVQDVRGVNVPQVRYWGTRTDVLTLDLSASDAESDIAAYEVAIGTRPNGTDLRDWAPVFGERTRNGAVANAGIRVSLRDMPLETGQLYYLCARATNGQGLTSAPRCLDGAIALDTTPPSAPRAVVVDPRAAGGFTLFGNLGNPVAQNVRVQFYATQTNRPARQAAFVPNAADPAALTFRWDASTDAESGVWQYEIARYNRSVAPDEAFANLNAGDVRTTSDTHFTMRVDDRMSGGGFFAYSDTAFVYVRAQNRALGYSEVIEAGRARFVDPTAPSMPRLHIHPSERPALMYLTRLSADPESGIAGYQFAIGTRLGLLDVKGWGEGLDLTTERVMVQMGQGNRSGVFYLGAHLVQQMRNAGQPVYLHLRAINGDGTPSAVAATGPYVADATPPVLTRPRVTVERGRLKRGIRTLTLTATLPWVEDRESGLAHLTMQVEAEDADGTYRVVAQGAAEQVFAPAPRQRQRNLALTSTFRVPEATASLRVRITATNASGVARPTTVVRMLQQAADPFRVPSPPSK